MLRGTPETHDVKRRRGEELDFSHRSAEMRTTLASICFRTFFFINSSSIRNEHWGPIWWSIFFRFSLMHNRTRSKQRRWRRSREFSIHCSTSAKNVRVWSIWRTTFNTVRISFPVERRRRKHFFHRRDDDAEIQTSIWNASISDDERTNVGKTSFLRIEVLFPSDRSSEFRCESMFVDFHLRCSAPRVSHTENETNGWENELRRTTDLLVMRWHAE